MSSSLRPKSSSVRRRPSKLPEHLVLSPYLNFEEDAAITPCAADFEPLRAAGFVNVAAIDGEVEIAEIFGGPVHRQRVALPRVG